MLTFLQNVCISVCISISYYINNIYTLHQSLPSFHFLLPTNFSAKFFPFWLLHTTSLILLFIVVILIIAPLFLFIVIKVFIIIKIFIFLKTNPSLKGVLYLQNSFSNQLNIFNSLSSIMQ